MRNRGIALFLTMGFSVILVMMLAATLTSTHGANIFSQDYHRKTAALYAAESGLAIVQEHLEADLEWAEDLDEDTPLGTGHFSVSFGPSVNNLEGDADIMGPYGPVRPGTAYVRVEGRALGQTEVIECVLGRKSEDFLKSAITASGKIRLGGSVKITGRSSSDDLGLTQADVISNYDQAAPWEDGTAPVSWDGGSTLDDQIKGTIRSASPSSNSVTPNLVGIADHAIVDHAPVTLQNINIKREIQLKSGAASYDSSVLNLLPQDYHAGGSRTVAGDLVLDNSRLYVDGDLTVLGSIKGTGAVYVFGDTVLSGDAEVLSNEDGVVLFSHGNVHLRGFNGTEWMDAVTGNSAAWQKTKSKIELLQNYLQDFSEGDTSPMIPPGSSQSEYWASPAGLALAVLASPIPQPPGDPQTNLLYQMVQVIDSQPSGRTQDFMSRKFTALRNPERVSEDNPPVGSGVPGNIRGAIGINYGDPPGSAVSFHEFLGVSPYESSAGKTPSVGLQLSLWVAAALHRPGSNGFVPITATGEPYEGLTEPQLRRALTKYTHWLDLYDFDRLGSSFFQGNIYTRGAFCASNEVTIVGSLSAVADPKESATPWSPEGESVTLKPGDVYLGQGTRILHMDELLPGPKTSRPSVGVIHWLR